MFKKHLLLLSRISFIVLVCWAPGLTHGKGINLPTSGIYDNTLLGFDESTKIVTGYFFDSRGDGDISPVFNCSFFFTGLAGESEIQLLILQPTIQSRSSHGKLILRTVNGKAAIRITLEEEQPGCMNVYPKDELRNDDLFLKHIMQWKQVRLISKTKAFFAKIPSQSAITKRYVVKGDVVSIIEEKNGWARAVFRSGKSTTEGWLTIESFYPIEKP